MSFDNFGDINWPAVLVAALVYFLLGALWYSPAFLGKPWMRSTGMETEDTEGGPGPAIYVAPLLGYLISSIATALLAEATATDSLEEGLILGLIVGVGFSAVLAGITAVFSPKMPEPLTWFWITASYNVVGLLLVGAILGLWE